MGAVGNRREPQTTAAASRRKAMKLLGEGVAVAEVARRLKVHRRTVEKWRAAPEGAQELAAATQASEATFASAVAEARRLLTEAAPDAARTLVDHLDHHDPQAALRAAATLLDRIGVPRTQRVENAEPEGADLSVLTDEEFAELRRIKAKLKASG